MRRAVAEAMFVARHRIAFGQTIVNMPLMQRQLLKMRRRMGYLFQNAALFDSLTVAENVAFPLREAGIRDKAEIEQRVQALNAFLEMSGAVSGTVFDAGCGCGVSCDLRPSSFGLHRFTVPFFQKGNPVIVPTTRFPRISTSSVFPSFACAVGT